MGQMIWFGLLWLAGLLGFAYIIWTLAIKENGAIRLTGQVIAAAIAIITIVIFVYSALYGCKMGAKDSCGMMGDHKMMMKDGAKMEMMHKMMMDKTMKK